MSNLVLRLWKTSPASLMQAIERRRNERKRKPGWYKVKAGPAAGLELLLPHAEDGGWLEMVEGTFDLFLYEALSAIHSLDSSTVWDIGAHIGYHTLGFLAQGARVISFEPNHFNAERLRQNMERNPQLSVRAKVLPYAVSDADGEMEFVFSSDMGGESSGSHLANATKPLSAEAYKSFGKSSVRTVRIDSLIQSGEPPPDVIKIDIEGAEFLALAGGLETLKRFSPMLLIEVHHICLMLKIQNLLGELGYRTRLLDEEHASPSRCFIMGTR